MRYIHLKNKKIAKDLISEFESKVLNKRPENRENSPKSEVEKKENAEEDDFDGEDIKIDENEEDSEK